MKVTIKSIGLDTVWHFDTIEYNQIASEIANNYQILTTVGSKNTPLFVVKGNTIDFMVENKHDLVRRRSLCFTEFDCWAEANLFMNRVIELIEKQHTSE